jgi:hypothetical protein
MSSRKGKGGGNRQTHATVPESATDAPRWTAVVAFAVACIVVAGTVARIVAARNEFWLDEIFSLKVFAANAKSPFDIFTLHWDNNHYLVTLWMYVVGDRANWFIYRLPSIVAGVGTILLAAVIARRWGNFATFTAAVLTGSSCFLITYGSEARGYALAGFFALAAFLALDRYLTVRGPAAGIAFSVATILGFLSHLTFLQFYLGAVAWSVVSCYKNSSTWAAGDSPDRGLPRHAVLLSGHALFARHPRDALFRW